MARLTNRLTARGVETAKPGRHLDGGGLYLSVSPGGSRSWVFVYRFGGKRPEMGLGPYPTVTLAAAREKAAEVRRKLADGLDPLASRHIAPRGQSFGSFAAAWLDTVEGQWRNAKHRAQWRSTLTTHCAGIWSKPIRAVDTADVLACLRPIWTKTPETAGRVRSRIETVLSAAKAQGLRTGDNPARWRDHLDHLLPDRPRLARGHHRAVPYQEASSVFAALRARHSVSSYALQWTILTAARTSETLGMHWDEIQGDVWTVSASRMKANRPHRVPLAPACMDLLDLVRPLSAGVGFVFRAPSGSALSNMAMDKMHRLMGLDATVHGWRSTFRDWAGDATTHPREVIEAALAHVIGDRTEAAYRRGDALERRRALMVEWAGFLIRL